VQNNYAPHLTSVTEAMLTELPPPSGDFRELLDFLETHRAAQDATHINVYNFANGTHDFATAAQHISKEYRGADAFSHARVADVNAAFEQVTAPEGTSVDIAGDA
jgi:hypothetical protein